jgi:glutathione S-transferase
VTVANLPAGEHRQPAYLAINPKGTIPPLQLDDGRVLTSFAAIALWLARQYPRARLLPDDPALAPSAIDLLDHVVGTLHGQGWTRIFTTDAYLPPGLPAAEAGTWRAAIQAQGREIVDQGFSVIAQGLPDDGYAVGAALSIADTALFYVEFWADKTGVPLPPRCAAHYRRMRALSVVQRVLAEEGYR